MYTLKRQLLGLALVVAAASAFGCGGGTGPVKVSIPDFYSPLISGVSYTPNPAVAGGDIIVTATVSDSSGLSSVALQYRTVGTTAFTRVEASTAIGGAYSFTIPGAALVSPGVEYYLVATDGENTSYDPATAPASLNQILINYVVIAHNAIAQAKSGSPLTVSATLTSDTAIDQTKSGFRYRTAGGGAFTEVLFGTRNGDIYSGTWPALGLADGTSYEYYVFAESAGGAKREYPENASTAGAYLTLAASASVNNKPVAIPSGPATAAVGQEIQLTANYSDDGPGPYSYQWAKGAGTTTELTDYASSTTTFRPPQTGTYVYTLTVSDGKALSDPVSVSVVVGPRTLPQAVAAGETYTATNDGDGKWDVPITGMVVEGTLKIEAGVTVRVPGNVGIEIRTTGNLSASGTKAQPIVFTSIKPNPVSGDWTGIYLNNTPNLPASTINFCTVQYSRDGIVLTNAKSPTISECTITLNLLQGVLCDASSVTINKCQIVQNGENGVLCRNGSDMTVSSNTVSGNRFAGIYCDASKIDLAKNTLTENKYGAYIANCSGANVVNVFANKIHVNDDGLRIENSKPVVQANDIFTNKDNGIIAYTTDARITAGDFCAPIIVSNAIHNNRDDGIHLENCYPAGPRAYAGQGLVDRFEIYSNVISFSGGEGIECKGSSPIVNHCIIGQCSNNGILCLAGDSAAAPNRTASPFIKNNALILNARAALAVKGDKSVNAANVNEPCAWWNGYYLNTNLWIDMDQPGVELANPVTNMDFSSDTLLVDADNNPSTPPVLVMVDMSYAAGSRATYTGPAGRFGWNLHANPLFDHATNINSAKWEDPFSVNWAVKSDDDDPRDADKPTDFVIFVDKYPTSDLINSGEPVIPGVQNQNITLKIWNPAAWPTL